MTRDLSGSVTEKFNGYEIIQHELVRKEKIKFVAINIVYEPIYDENVPVPYYFTDKIHLGYRSYIGRSFKGEKKINHPTVRQCHYCEIFLKKVMKI